MGQCELDRRPRTNRRFDRVAKVYGADSKMPGPSVGGTRTLHRSNTEVPTMQTTAKTTANANATRPNSVTWLPLAGRDPWQLAPPAGFEPATFRLEGGCSVR
jgi:hypothetical protein